MKLKQLLALGAAIVLAAANLNAIKTSEMVRHDAAPLPVLGSLAPDASKAYSRLPDSLKPLIREELWNLGLNSAGMALRFRSDATDIGAAWRSLNRFSMNHMTPTGIRGLDLYVLQPDSSWTTLGSGRPSLSSHSNTSRIMSGMEREMREYMLYLPLYDGVDSIFILTDSAARVLPPEVDLPRRSKPMVMYGTSLLQGGCASRPGMVHTSILGRMFNREVVNLGFSGNARLDPEIARLMASADASLYVVDALPNCTPELVAERMDAFIDILRAARPDVPILLVESPMFPGSRFDKGEFETLAKKNDNLRAIYDRRRASDSRLYYMTADQILTDPETTVDNYHYTDTGFVKFADAMRPIIAAMLGD